MLNRTCLVVLTVVASLTTNAWSATYTVNPGMDWYSVVGGSGLEPGDEVVMEAGTYTRSANINIRHRGTAEAPIVIRAADGAKVTFTHDINHNVLQFYGAQYLTLRGVEVTGGSAGIRIYEDGSSGHVSKFLTIEDCHVHHTDQNAITANAAGTTYEGMIFRRNEINNTGGHGEAFYLGSNYNASQFFNGLIEGNYIHDLVNIGGNFQGDGIELKLGSYGNVVRGNVIHDVNYPGIIVYGTVGHEDQPNIIEGNVIWNSRDNGIQAASDAIVRNNIVFNCSNAGFKSHEHQGALPGNLEVVHNTFIQPNGAPTIYISGGSGTDGPIVVANNAAYKAGSGDGINVPNGTVLAGNYSSSDPAADFGNISVHDVFPLIGSGLIDAGSLAYAILKDFNGTDRDGTVDAGAYKFDPAGNPGWIVTDDFKPLLLQPGDCDCDGDVDVADLDTFTANWNTAATDRVWATGDFDGDGDTDSVDLAALGLNWNPTGMVQVPEPATLTILSIAAVVALRRRR